jgi:hypothetical protein
METVLVTCSKKTIETKGDNTMANIIEKVENNGYTYTRDDKRNITAEGPMKNDRAERSPYAQKTAGGEARLPGDHGGHGIPAANGGMKDGMNITAQDSKVNTRDVRAVERDESKAIDNGFSINTQRIASFGSNPERPDGYMINDHVTAPDGHFYDVHHSFTNTDMAQYENNYEGLENAPSSYNAPGGAHEHDINYEDFNSMMDEMNEQAAGFNDYDGNWTSHSTDIDLGKGHSVDMSDFGESQKAYDSDSLDQDSDGYADYNQDGDSYSM